MQESDPISQACGLIEVMRRQQDRVVVLITEIADEGLHLPLAADVEARRRLVEQEQHRRGEECARDRHLLLHPARELLEWLLPPTLLDGQAGHGRQDFPSRDLTRPPKPAPPVPPVLPPPEPLEERRPV